MGLEARYNKMSLCYDFQKWTIISMLAILTVCLVGMVNLVFGQQQNSTVVDNQTVVDNRTQRELELDKYRKMIEEDIKKGGRVPTDAQLQNCIAYEGINLIVIGPQGQTQCVAVLDTINYYLSQGYTLKAVDNGQAFLEKIK
ncbi:MAG TPA: hypothetical protein VIP29_06110 [Nitrososphaeraceae archaeon]